MKVEKWMLDAAREVKRNIQPDLLSVSKFNVEAFAKIIAKHAPIVVGHHRRSHDGPCEPDCYYETLVRP